MSTYFRRCRSRSLLDSECAPSKIIEIRDRLKGRLQGERGLFITLTYNRQGWGSPLECYRASKDLKHVARFMQKVARTLRGSLRGRWMCKMEFQTDGWVHYHIVLLGVRRIPHARLTALWGHGHVWVNALKPGKHGAYLAKYVAKLGETPEWVYTERARAVKVFSASPGFWSPPDECDDADDGVDGDADDDEAVNTCDPPGRMRLPYWVPLGDCIAEAGQRAYRKDVSGDGRVRWSVVRLPEWALLWLSAYAGCSASRIDGWWRIDAPDWRDWIADSLMKLESVPGGEAARTLHLIRNPNRAQHAWRMALCERLSERCAA